MIISPDQKFTELDDSQSLYFSRQLQQIDPLMYGTKYPDLEAERLLPSRIQVDPALDVYVRRQFDMRGEAVPMAGNEDGAPLVGLNASEALYKMEKWISAYGWDVDEIRKSAKLGMDLNTKDAEAARRTIAEKLNKVALLGLSTKGIEGLFNVSIALTYTIPADGSGSLATFASKTVDQVLRDLFGMADYSQNQTIDIETPRRMLLPKTTIRQLSVLRMGSVNDTTVLEFFKAQRPNLEIIGANYLDTAGSGTTKRAVVYDPSQVEWLVSMPFNQLAPQFKGFRQVINCEGKGGGVVTSYPKSIVYGDGF